MSTAVTILEDLTRRGFILQAHGGKVRVAPRDAVTEEIRQVIRTHREEILTLLRLKQPLDQPEATPPTRDPLCPWSLRLPGFGEKSLGRFTPCRSCGAGTWVRYGMIPLCLGCTRKPAAAPAVRLHWLLNEWSIMGEATWAQEAVDRLKDRILDIFQENPEAEGWYCEWKQGHPEAR